jgi:hypothetical protein
MNTNEGDDEENHDARPPSSCSSTSKRPKLSTDPTPRSFSPWSDMSSTNSESEQGSPQPLEGDVSSLDVAMVEVEQIIDHLTRLGVAIRKSGANSRAQRADRLFKPEDHEKLFHHLTVRVLGRGSEEGREHYNIHPSSLSTVQERLIMANLRRRNRFLYAQRHAQKLAFDAPSRDARFISPSSQSPAFVSESVVQQPRAPDLGLNEDSPQDAAVDVTPISHPVVLTATSASLVGTTIREVPRQMATPSQIAKTNITSTTAKTVYPRPPRIREGLRYFQCPCCCQTLPSLYGQDTQWKSVHLLTTQQKGFS